MTYEEALAHYETAVQIAAAAGISTQRVYLWKKGKALVPEKYAIALHNESEGQLPIHPEHYKEDWHEKADLPGTSDNRSDSSRGAAHPGKRGAR